MITLIRLWGHPYAVPKYHTVLENFLHLMISVRILTYQLLTDLDIAAFELHYMRYWQQLKQLYPSQSFVPVQHLGLHIPKFLHALGPSTHYSKSTCEQFIGMFQNISMNFKFGNLELTLHREFMIASHLKGMVEQPDFTQLLQEFSQIVEEFLQQRMPSGDKHTWQTSHGRNPLPVPDPLYRQLSAWSEAHHATMFPQSLFYCTSMRLGNVVYAPHASSGGNSCVIFSTVDEQILPGQIEHILEEPARAPTSRPHIILVVHTFQPLSLEDSLCNPYLNNGIIGQSGAGLVRLYYNETTNNIYLIEPRNLVAHMAVCQYNDPGVDGWKMSHDCIIVVSLDLTG
ncbi:hypothetical protein FRC08_006479 [Ceratobasidium sp. 394]|nr:hypothetical protein FRC08_006479 [Ceratobasidium sp. 394]